MVHVTKDCKVGGLQAKLNPGVQYSHQKCGFFLSPQCPPVCQLYSRAVLPVSHKASCTVVSVSSIVFMGFILFVQPLGLCKSPNENKEMIENDKGMLRQQSYICTKALNCFKSKV